MIWVKRQLEASLIGAGIHSSCGLRRLALTMSGVGTSSTARDGGPRSLDILFELRYTTASLACVFSMGQALMCNGGTL
jgi:hypothetical protein